MCTHAIRGPLDLTDPTPLKGTARPCAHHMHAPASSFCGRTTLGTGFCQDPDCSPGCIIGRGVGSTLE